MVNRPKQIGTRAETAIVRHAIAHGFPDAERLALAGAADKGDIRLAAGVLVESKGGGTAKGAGAIQISHWLAETETERVHHGADIGLLVVQRDNRSLPGVAGWDAWLPRWTLAGRVDVPIVDQVPVRLYVRDALTLLRFAGYGEPLELAGDDPALLAV